ncbi:MAG: MATE family efflux transporter [Sulfitobacter sp.]
MVRKQTKASKKAFGNMFSYDDLRDFLRLAIPLGFAQVSVILIVTTDVMMIGWLGGPKSLAAGVLAQAYFAPIIVFCIGILASVSVVISQYLGEGKTRAAARSFWAGHVVALIMACPAGLLVAAGPQILALIGQDVQLLEMAQSYYIAMAFALVLTLVNVVLIELAIAHELSRMVLFVSVIQIVANVVFNYVFMFGVLGWPGLGFVGAGISTICVAIVAMFSLGVGLLRVQAVELSHWNIPRPSALVKEIWDIFSIGLPIGCMEFSTVSFFSAMTLAAGYFGTVALGAHGIAMQVSELALLFCIGIGEAAAVRIAYSTGKNSIEEIVRSTRLALFSGVAFILACSVVLFVCSEGIPKLFLDNSNHSIEISEISDIATKLIKISTVFLLANAVQIVIAGILRGSKDTVVPFMLSVGGNWFIGAGIGFYLAFIMDMQVFGLWMGVIAGQFAMSGALAWRLANRVG